MSEEDEARRHRVARMVSMCGGCDERDETIDELRAALAGLVGCIDESAANRGPEITRDSMMARVCRVIQTTGQYDRAKALLGRPQSAG